MYPKIVDLGPVTIHTYGLLLALAFIAGIWLTSRNARKEGLDPDKIWNLGLIIIFSALVGAKILLFLSDFSYYSQNPREIFSLSTLRSAGVYYGGLLLALAASAVYLRKTGLPGWTVSDLAAPGIALGSGDRAPRLPFGRVLLWQAYSDALGNHLHRPVCVRQRRRAAQYAASPDPAL